MHGCFCATSAELSSCDRLTGLQSLMYLLTDPLQKSLRSPDLDSSIFQYIKSYILSSVHHKRMAKSISLHSKAGLYFVSSSFILPQLNSALEFGGFLCFSFVVLCVVLILSSRNNFYYAYTTYIFLTPADYTYFVSNYYCMRLLHLTAGN